MIFLLVLYHFLSDWRWGLFCCTYVPCVCVSFFLAVIFQLALESSNLRLRLLSQAVLTGFMQEKSLQIYCTSFSEQKCLGLIRDLCDLM